MPGSNAVVKNQIALALVERILSAARDGEKLKVCAWTAQRNDISWLTHFTLAIVSQVIVVIPEVPW